ncbi:histidine kinase [Gramella sp. AN32]|uniref:Sensor histidine kinase n=1 Tax=Christiangramia antarctica TaxID=2058158 RepID=A0ABW5XCD7_9FLAO|nr:histidine kinase [Gramella sp. AN32]MCM4155506.1 histidine kinase [Gramella sp. AN32]
MERSKRYIFQVVLWFGIWLVLWLLEGLQPRFLLTNIPAFICQSLLLAGLIFYASPLLLFQKKYWAFLMISIISVVGFAYFSAEFGPAPPRLNAPLNPSGPLPPQLPSKFFIHLLMISLSYILATLLETFLYAQEKEKENIRNKNENLQTEIKLLKSQINPHFLFNALNNIYALSAIDPAKTQESISYLSDMLRYVLYECEQDQVPLEKEVTYMENYIKLFTLKSSNPYPIKTDFKIGNNNLQIAPMLFIPFMENALKHSNIEKRGNTYIKLKLHANNREIFFEIENSIPENPIHKDAVGGIGIENVKRRLKILYPDRHQLQIKSQPTSFLVQLNIAIDEKN